MRAGIDRGDTREYSVMTATWQERLDAATSEAGVVAVARDFVQQLRGDLIERLPADLRPGVFKDAAEVAAYAFSVVLHRLQGGGEEIAEHTEMIAAFFMSAAARLTQIMATRPKESPGST